MTDSRGCEHEGVFRFETMCRDVNDFCLLSFHLYYSLSYTDSISEEERRRLLSILEGFKTVPTVPKSDPLSDPSSLSLSRLMGEIGKVHVQVNSLLCM